MTTRETIDGYFSSLKLKGGWDAFLADDMVFTSFAAPTKQVTGRVAYLQTTGRFYSMIKSVEVRHLIVDGDHACALTRYELQPPAGPAFHSDVAEVFGIRHGKIASFDTISTPRRFPSSGLSNVDASWACSTEGTG